MSIKVKIIGILSTILMLGFLAGCTSGDGIKVSKAFVKSLDAENMEVASETSVNIDLKGYDVDSETKQILDMVNGATITATTKSDVKNNKSFTTANLDLNGIGFKASSYADNDKVWVKIPGQSKYIEIDPKDLLTKDEDMAAYKASMGMQKDIKPLAMKFMKSYIGDFKHKFNSLQNLGTKTISTPEGSKQVEAFSVAICNTGFQNLVKDILDDAPSNKALKEYMLGVLDVTAKSMSKEELKDYDPEKMKEEINKAFAELETNKNNNTAAFLSEMSKYFEVGTEKWQVEVDIDSDGNVVSVDSKFPFAIKNPDNKDQKIVVKLNTKSTIYNVNKTVVDIPNFTDENSIKLKDFVKASPVLKDSPLGEALGVQPKRVSLMVGSSYALTKDGVTELDAEPYIEGESTLVPVRFVGESIGAKVDWNDEDKAVTYIDGNKIIIMVIGEDIAYVNGEPIQMPVAPVIKNGRTMVPVRFVSEQFGAKVGWDGDTQEITIEK